MCGVMLKCVSVLYQDFADMVSQPTLEGPTESERQEEEEEKRMKEEESSESASLSTAVMNTVVRIHQQLCVGHAHSLWYHSTKPTNRSKEHITALVSSYQIASPLMSRFYHLIGQCSCWCVDLFNLL